MTEATLAPSEQDLNALKSELDAAKRQAQYEKLKNDLYDITYKAANTPNEFAGTMQISDTHKVLKTKRPGTHFFELLFDRIRGMFSLRPIIGNIIALLIAGMVLFYIFNAVNTAGFEKYQNVFAIGIQLFAAIQIIKSATRGLLLPVLALLIGASLAHSLGAHQTLWHFNRTFYEHLMITGIIGLGVAVLSID
jgi:hypothetical protein